MKMVNRNGEEVNVDKHQVASLLNAGWSRIKPKTASEESQEPTGDSSSSGSDGAADNPSVAGNSDTGKSRKSDKVDSKSVEKADGKA